MGSLAVCSASLAGVTSATPLNSAKAACRLTEQDMVVDLSGPTIQSSSLQVPNKELYHLHELSDIDTLSASNIYSMWIKTDPQSSISSSALIQENF